jgi:PhzF family phenazine biosynthesis protein
MAREPTNGDSVLEANMPRLFHLVDAFTSEAFRGNPAAVYLLDSWPADAWLQTVAREMNQSETAFVVPNSAPAGQDLRWFTPTIEVDLCGHATLASAHVLWITGKADASQPLVFHTRSGKLEARQRDDLIELDFPLLREEKAPEPAELAQALGIKPDYVGKSRYDWIVQVNTEAEVRQAQVDFSRLRKIATRGVILTAQSSDPAFDFVSRFFAPAAGIDEDPVTGSAHCCLADFWHKRLKKNSFRAYQASSRGGVVHVRISGERVILGGRAVTAARGELLCEPS